MFLSDLTIQEYIEKGKIVIDGGCEIETTGISLHISNELLIPKPYQIVDSNNPKEIEYIKYILTQTPYVLRPNEFVLSST